MKLLQLLKKRKKSSLITERMCFSLFLTGVIIEFSQVGAGFIDGLAISRFMGPEEMAAEGIAHPIFSILGIVSGLIAVGMQVRCSQAIGRGKVKEYSEFVSASVYVGFAASLIITAIVLIFNDPIAVLLGARGNASHLAEHTAQYLFGLGIGVPPLIMTAILAPALQLDSGNRIIQIGALIEAFSNMVLDFVAVKLDMGIFGIGLATSLASYFNLLYQCSFFFKKDRSLHLIKPNISVVAFLSMLANGNEKAFKRLMNTIRPIILNTVIIAYGGTIAMSALSIRNNFADFIEIFGAGIASAISLVVGVYYGEINEEGIEEVGHYGHKMIMMFSGSICLLVFIFARPIADIYVTEDGEILDMVTFTIRMLALQNPLQAFVSSRIKYLQSIHKKHNMNLLIFVAQFAFVIGSAYVLGELFDVYGILACFTASDFLTLISIYLFYAIKCRRLFVTKKDYLNLPDSFYLKPGDVISLKVNSVEDAMLCSEQIMLFGKGHKADSRIAYFAALSFEELAVNAMEHDYQKRKEISPILDVRVAMTNDMFVIRMRDNCPKYDVTQHIARANEACNDLTSDIGIRLVSEIASDITYLNTFNTNSLIICFDMKEKVSIA